MTCIKICGIRDKSHALAAIEAGADFIGLVFAASKRQVTLTEASEIANAVKKNSDTAKVVGVFVNAPSQKVNEIADFCALDWVQLSGDESWEYCREINKPIIKAVRINSQSLNVIQSINAKLSIGSKLLTTQMFLPLLDSQVEGKYGGTGSSFNWNIARQVAKRFPVIIAGGLNPENVAQVIEAVAPWGVDVSSGVEVKGVKDMAKIRAFIEAVKKIDATHVVAASRSPELFASCHSERSEESRSAQGKLREGEARQLK